MKRLLFALTSFLVISCKASMYELELTTDSGVSFEAYVHSIDPEHNPTNNLFKVNGSITIKNNSETTIKYSNKDVFFIIEGEGKSRTYLNSPASHVVDFSHIQIQAGETKSFNVHWYLPPVKSLNSEHVLLQWNKST
jgi:hypothetical protein